jgi:hypothetical protein
MHPVLKESSRDMFFVFHTIFGHITFDVAAVYEITQEEFIEMINRTAIKGELPLFSRAQFLGSVMGYLALKNVLKSLLPFASS